MNRGTHNQLWKLPPGNSSTAWKKTITLTGLHMVDLCTTFQKADNFCDFLLFLCVCVCGVCGVCGVSVCVCAHPSMYLKMYIYRFTNKHHTYKETLQKNQLSRTLTSLVTRCSILTLVLLNPDISCLCKHCRSTSVGF